MSFLDLGFTQPEAVSTLACRKPASPFPRGGGSVFEDPDDISVELSPVRGREKQVFPLAILWPLSLGVVLAVRVCPCKVTTATF